MIGINKFAMRAAVVMLALPVSAAIAQRAPRPAPQPAPAGIPTGPVQPLEYAVKFICGRNALPGQTSSMTALGNYYTAINIHNPSPNQDFTYKVTVALLGTPGGMTDFHPYITIRYDQAIDFDCRLIRNILSQASIPVQSLYTGFFVIQAPRQLDVVAIYTAAPSNTNQVATMHTERVPVRRVQ